MFDICARRMHLEIGVSMLFIALICIPGRGHEYEPQSILCDNVQGLWNKDGCMLVDAFGFSNTPLSYSIVTASCAVLATYDLPLHWEWMDKGIRAAESYSQMA